MSDKQTVGWVVKLGGSYRGSRKGEIGFFSNRKHAHEYYDRAAAYLDSEILNKKGWDDSRVVRLVKRDRYLDHEALEACRLVEHLVSHIFEHPMFQKCDEISEAAEKVEQAAYDLYMMVAGITK